MWVLSEFAQNFQWWMNLFGKDRIELVRSEVTQNVLSQKTAHTRRSNLIKIP